MEGEKIVMRWSGDEGVEMTGQDNGIGGREREP